MPDEAPQGEVVAGRGLDALQKRLGVQFADVGLLARAVTHRSWLDDRGGDRLESYERLEFLGDAVVQLIVSDWLYRNHPTLHEGRLSALRSGLVRADSLARAGARLGLDEPLLLGGGVATNRERGRRSLLSSCFEAVLGAVYLDQGWPAAQELVGRALGEDLERAHLAPERNLKGELQEETQARWKVTPDYCLVDSGGPPHARWFAVEAQVAGQVLGAGRGASKKEAEQAAAAVALATLLGSGAQQPARAEDS